MALGLVLCLLAATPTGPTIQRCPAGKAAVQAGGLLDTVDASLKARDGKALEKAWAEVRRHRCFALPFLESARQPDVDDVEAIAQWWEAGGRSWLESGFAKGSSATYAVVPPDAPTRLKEEDAAGAARLLCARDAPTSCGVESAGWALRAAEALAQPDSHDSGEDAKEKVDCLARTKSADGGEPYQAWRACLEETRPLVAVLPLGRFDAPRDGWLVLRGRRGHHTFCDEVRAYQLATGAAWVAQSCAGLALRKGGSVDKEATDAGRGVSVKVGRVPVEALREAAWMTILAPHVVDNVQPFAWFVPLPKGLEPRWRGDGAADGTLLGSFWVTSAQTHLAWSWQGAEGLRGSGVLTWPDSSRAGEDHAARLWRIAEAAFQEGCAPARLPKQLVVGSAPGVSRVDASPASLRDVESRLMNELFASPDGCGDGGR